MRFTTNVNSTIPPGILPESRIWGFFWGGLGSDVIADADELAKVPKSGKAMAVAGIFERLSGGNSETANRLDMLLLLDALTGLARVSPAFTL